MATRKAATKNGFLIFIDQLPLFENIPDENLGKAIKLLIKNFNNMEVINEDAFTNMAYELIATNIRRYRKESIQATEYGKQGGNPSLNPTLKGTHKQQDKTRQNKTKQENIDIYMRGEYKNVYLPDGKLREFETKCLNKKLASDIICYLSEQIEQGKDEDFNSDKPNAHFVRLNQLLKVRMQHPEWFNNKAQEPVNKALQMLF